MSEQNTKERRQYSRRQCDQHEICVVQFQAELKTIHSKINVLCDRSKKAETMSERIGALEAGHDRHTEHIAGEVEWRKDHEKFKDRSIEQQRERDEDMDRQINDLRIATEQLTTTIVKTESELKLFVNEKIDNWRKPIWGAAVTMLLTCISAVGALTLFVLDKLWS